MKSFLILTCLAAFFSKNVTAFTYFVPNLGQEKGGFCVSNDTGLNEESENDLAPIYDLDPSQPHLPSWEREHARKTDLWNRECFFDKNCTWKTESLQTELVLSEEPILDNEWNFLPVTVTTGGINFIDKLFKDGHYDAEKFHVSVLADTAFFLFSHNLSCPGILLVVDAIDANKTSRLLLKEFSSYSGEMTLETNFSQEIKNVELLHGGKMWVHLTFEIKNRTDGFKLTISDGKKNYSFYKIRSWNTRQFTQVRVRSMDKIGFFKLHQYEVLRSSSYYNYGNRALLLLQYSFRLYKSKRFCVDVVYKGQWFATLMSKEIGRENVVLTKKLTMSKSNEWKTERIEIDHLDYGNYIFNLSALNKSMDIKVKSCMEQDSLIIRKQVNGNIVGCQLITKDEVISKSEEVANERKDLLDENVLKKICSEAESTDCKFVQACDQTGCFCLSGFTSSGHQKCSEACHKGTFGPNCAWTSKHICERNTDIHTGECTGEQYFGFLKYLEIKARVFSVQIDANNSFDSLSEFDRKQFDFAEIQLRKTKGNGEWGSAIRLTKRNGTISDLDQNTAYQIRVVIYEKDNRTSVKREIVDEFTTGKCTPIETSIIEKKGTESSIFEEDPTCRVSLVSIRPLHQGIFFSFESKYNFNSEEKNMLATLRDESGKEIQVPLSYSSLFKMSAKGEDNKKFWCFLTV